ncbi:MAG: glycosyltransferase family 4 protein [Pseudohongiella sp.]|nr:glycosyltransferase family 4 protein [Pseudohongiella sp.]
MSSVDLAIDSVLPRKRIAVIAPGMEILGGQGVQAAALMNELANDGFNVTFIPVNPRFPRTLGWLRKIPYLRTLLNQWLYRLSLRAIKNVDVVHLFSASYWSFLLAQVPAIDACTRYGKPVILNYHSGEADDHLRNWGMWVHPWIERVEKIVVPSLYLQQVFASYGYKARVIPNIVSLRQFNYRQRKPILPHLLSVRNLESIYRVGNTLAAYRLIKEKFPGATLTVAGYGSEEQKLKAYVRENNIRDVIFVGRVEPDNIAALYDQADIFVNSSVVDNQPLSILEAFAAGLPVISTSVGDIPQMITHQKTGLLVAADQPDAIAEAVFWILEHQSETAEIAGAARCSVKKYTWQCVRTEWTNLFEETTS